MFDVVIASHNEDLSWVSTIPGIERIFLYDKGTKPIECPVPVYYYERLPNIGREADTYLYHIIKHYTDLGEYTVFLQGNPTDHLQGNEIRLMEADFRNIVDTNLKSEIYYFDHRVSPYGLPVMQKCLQYFEMKCDTKLEIYLSRGAQFSCSKKCIQYRPLKFYEYIMAQLHNIQTDTPGTWVGLYTEQKNEVDKCIDPWTMERMWPMIFDMKLLHRI